MRSGLFFGRKNILHKKQCLILCMLHNEKCGIVSVSAYMSNSLNDNIEKRDYRGVLGFDWYSGGNYEIANNSAYKQLASTGKPFAFAEWGGPRAKLDEGQKQEDVFTAEDMLGIIRRLAEDGYSAAYLIIWTSPGTINEMTKGDVLMNADGILGMEDVSKMI